MLDVKVMFGRGVGLVVDIDRRCCFMRELQLIVPRDCGVPERDDADMEIEVQMMVSCRNFKKLSDHHFQRQRYLQTLITWWWPLAIIYTPFCRR